MALQDNDGPNYFQPRLFSPVCLREGGVSAGAEWRARERRSFVQAKDRDTAAAAAAEARQQVDTS